LTKETRQCEVRVAQDIRKEFEKEARSIHGPADREALSTLKTQRGKIEILGSEQYRGGLEGTSTEGRNRARENNLNFKPRVGGKYGKNRSSEKTGRGLREVRTNPEGRSGVFLSRDSLAMQRRGDGEKALGSSAAECRTLRIHESANNSRDTEA